MHIEDLSEFPPDRLQGLAVFPPMVIWCQQVAEIAAVDRRDADSSPPKNLVEGHPGPSGMVRGGHHQNAPNSFFQAMLQGQFGIGERILRADKHGGTAVRQVTFRAGVADDLLPFDSAPRDQNQLSYQVLIVKADGPAQAIATITAEDHCRFRTHWLCLDHQPSGDGVKKANQGGES